jgi:hypothetical protein
VESVKNKNQIETLKTKSNFKKIENYTSRKNKWKTEFQEDKIDIKEKTKEYLHKRLKEIYKFSVITSKDQTYKSLELKKKRHKPKVQKTDQQNDSSRRVTHTGTGSL